MEEGFEEIVYARGIPYFIGMVQGNAEREIPKRQLTFCFKDSVKFDDYLGFFKKLFGIVPQIIDRSSNGFRKEFYFYYPKIIEKIREITANNLLPLERILKFDYQIEEYLKGFFSRVGHVGYFQIKKGSGKLHPHFRIVKSNKPLVREIRKLLNRLEIKSNYFSGILNIQQRESLERLVSWGLLPKEKEERLENLLKKLKNGKNTKESYAI